MAIDKKKGASASKKSIETTGNICRETSSEVLSTVSGITKEAPVKPIPRIRERPSPKEIQTDVVDAR